MLSKKSGQAFCLLALCLASRPGLAEDWGRFRGVNGTGVAENCQVPLPWQARDVRWKTELPGTGNSTPVVSGNRVFLMSTDKKTAKRYMQAIELATGAELWRTEAQTEPYLMHARSSYASSSPCATDDAVYFTWGSPANVHLLALNHDGQELWKRELGPFVSQHGYGISPAVFGNKVILFNSQAAEQLPEGQAPGQSQVMAFEATSGDLVWSTPRTTTRACYGVPTEFVDPNSGKPALLCANTGDGMFALDLETGAPLWHQPVFGKRSISCPIIVGDLAIGTEGSGGGGNILFAVDLRNPEHPTAFRIDRFAPYVPTPVALGDLVFMWSDKGIVSCVSTPDGETLWSKRIGGNVSSSPVIAGDKLIGMSEDGVVTILAASRDFQNLGTIKLGENSRATPVLGQDYLLLRTETHLTCVGARSK